MKKVFLVSSIIFLLSGCNEEQRVIEVNNYEVRFAGLEGTVRIVKDNETGCKYIRESTGNGYGSTVALTVLMKADGTADCEDLTNSKKEKEVE
ncbi:MULTISPECIES: DUF6440 family protein [unclassified Psychrobacillus]|uniref:DUF6440 family protein n=1 Tax=unclassified Psychrobacillus TaxID=2636677 RepID=UPI0030F6BE66